MGRLTEISVSITIPSKKRLWGHSKASYSEREVLCETLIHCVLYREHCLKYLRTVSGNRWNWMTPRRSQVTTRVLASLTSFVLRRPLAVRHGLRLSSLSLSPIYLCAFGFCSFVLVFLTRCSFSVFVLIGFSVSVIEIKPEVHHRLPQSAITKIRIR